MQNENNTTVLQDLDTWVAQWELVHGPQIPTDHLLEKIKSLFLKERATHEKMQEAEFTGSNFFDYVFPAHPTTMQEPKK